MIKKHYCLFWIYFLMIVVTAGCDSTSNNNDASEYQLTISASAITVYNGEYSSITATLTSVNTSVATGTAVPATAAVVGYPVTFTITKNSSLCKLTIVNSTTDTAGNVIAIYQSGSLSGIDIIQASIDKGQSASVSIFVNMLPTPTPTLTPTPRPTPTPTPTPTP